jgi:hypothetical protein
VADQWGHGTHWQRLRTALGALHQVHPAF